MDIITELMRSNQLSARDYINILSQLNKDYTETIQTAANTGDRRRQQLFTKKKDLVAREVSIHESCTLPAIAANFRVYLLHNFYSIISLYVISFCQKCCNMSLLLSK